MTRDQFRERWLDELTGLILAAHQAEHELADATGQTQRFNPQAYARFGQHVREHLKRGWRLLDRIYDEHLANGKTEPEKANGHKRT